MKKRFENPELSVEFFQVEDIVATSATDGDIVTPEDEF